MPGKQSMWWVEVPSEGRARVHVPEGQRVVITQATLELPGQIKDNLYNWGYPRWFTVKCAKDVGQSPKDVGPWLNIGTLAVPDDGHHAPTPMANPGFLPLRLVLDAPAIFTVMQYNHMGAMEFDPSKPTHPEAPRVHLAGYLEPNE